MSTLDTVKKVVVDQLSVDEKLVTPEARFTDDLGADSLDTVELVMALEEEFKCEIPDEDAEKIQTVQDAVSYIDSKLSHEFEFLKLNFINTGVGHLCFALVLFVLKKRKKQWKKEE